MTEFDHLVKMYLERFTEVADIFAALSRDNRPINAEGLENLKQILGTHSRQLKTFIELFNEAEFIDPEQN